MIMNTLSKSYKQTENEINPTSIAILVLVLQGKSRDLIA